MELPGKLEKLEKNKFAQEYTEHFADGLAKLRELHTESIDTTAAEQPIVLKNCADAYKILDQMDEWLQENQGHEGVDSVEFAAVQNSVTKYRTAFNILDGTVPANTGLAIIDNDQIAETQPEAAAALETAIAAVDASEKKVTDLAKLGTDGAAAIKIADATKAGQETKNNEKSPEQVKQEFWDQFKAKIQEINALQTRALEANGNKDQVTVRAICAQVLPEFATMRAWVDTKKAEGYSDESLAGTINNINKFQESFTVLLERPLDGVDANGAVQTPDAEKTVIKTLADAPIQNVVINAAPGAVKQSAIKSAPPAVPGGSGIAPVDGLTDAEQKLAELAKQGPRVAQQPEFDLSNLNIGIINSDDLVKAEARDLADRRMTEEKGKASLIGKIFKHNWFKEVNRQRHINRAEREITESQNLYTGNENTDASLSAEARVAIAERFASEYDELVNTQDGEQKEFLSSNEPGVAAAQSAIRDFVRLYATAPNPDDAAILSRKDSLVEQLSRVSPQQYRGGRMYSDNITAVAERVRQAVAAGQLIDYEKLQFNLVVGRAMHSLRTEANYNVVDNFIERLQRTKGTKLVNGPTMAMAAGLVYSFFGRTGKIFSNKLLAVATFGGTALVSGTIAGVQEHKRLAGDRKTHQREMAKGFSIEQGSRRRDEMEKYQYAMERANDLRQNLLGSLYQVGPDGARSLRNLDAAGFETAMQNVAAIEARVRLGNQRRMDLISYSHIGKVEKERFQLMRDVAEAKVALRRAQRANPQLVPAGTTFDRHLSNMNTALIESMRGGTSGMDARDIAFRQFQRRRAVKVGRNTAIAGAVIGTTLQEVFAAFDNNTQGLAEGIWNNQGQPDNTTALEALRRQIMGDGAYTHETGELTDVAGGKLDLPPDITAQVNPDGTVDFIREGNVIGDNLHIAYNADGSLSPESVSELGNNNFATHFDHHTFEPDFIPNPEPVEISDVEFMAKTPGTTHVARDLWFDNDTVKFDKNELRLDWGAGGRGVNANGDYVFSMKRMIQGDSYHGAEIADVMNKGQLSLYLSASEATQAHTFKFAVDPITQEITIPKDSEAARVLLAMDSNGHAVYNGRFAELAQFKTDAAAGIDHIKPLATYEGNGIDKVSIIPDPIPVPQDIHYNVIDRVPDWQMPPFIPIYKRTPLEKTLNEKAGPDFEPELPMAPGPTKKDEQVVDKMPIKDQSKEEVQQEQKTDAQLGLPGRSSVYAGPEGLAVIPRFQQQGQEQEVGALPEQSLVYLGQEERIRVAKNKNSNMVFDITPKDDKGELRGIGSGSRALGPKSEMRALEMNKDFAKEKFAMNTGDMIQEYLSKKSGADVVKIMETASLLPVMNPLCKVGIALVPAPDQDIAKTLDEYSNQTNERGEKLQPNSFEINIATSDADLLAKISTWKATNPGYAVNVISKGLPDSIIGSYPATKKFVQDTILMRSLQRTGEQRSIYIEADRAAVAELPPPPEVTE